MQNSAVKPDDIVWDGRQLCITQQPEDALVNSAALSYFRQPSVQNLGVLEQLLDVNPHKRMRQAVLILQVANAALGEEGEQLATIFAEQGKPLVCKQGCTRCCHQLVLCRPFEARLIKAFLDASPQILDNFIATYAVWDKTTVSFRQSYLAWAEGLYTRGEDDGSHVLEDYALPCPFLDTVGLCVIYPVRPYACRSSIAVDPLCAAPPQGHEGALQMQYSLYTSHHAARQKVCDMLVQRLNADARPVSMPEMVAAYLRDSGQAG